MSHRVLTALLLTMTAGLGACDKANSPPATGSTRNANASPAAPDVFPDPRSGPADPDNTGAKFEGQSPLTFEVYEHDFGRILDTEKVSTVFKFTNTSDKAVTLGKPRASCGCTVPTLAKSEYAPGEKGSIDVTFSPKGAGKTTKNITIPIDGMAPVELSISANVVPILSVEPRGVSFINVQRGTETSTPVLIRSRDPKMKIVSIEAVEKRVTVVVDDPGSTTDNADLPGNAGFRVVLPADTPVGMVNDKLILKVMAAAADGDEQKEQTIQLNVSGRVKGDLYTQPPALNIPALGPGEAFEAAALVRSVSNAEFKIESVEIRDVNFDGVTAEWDIYEFAGERSYRVTLRGTMPEAIGKMLSGIAVIHTNIPGEETIQIIFRGRVQPKGGPTPVGGPRPNPQS